MSENKSKYEEKLKKLLEELNNLNYSIDKEGNLFTTIPSLNSKHIDMSKYKLILKYIYKYIKLTLFLKYEMKKTRILPPNKDYFFSPKLIESQYQSVHN